MSKSSFTVKCPYCGEENNFTGDNWMDELINDSDQTEIECLHCDYPMVITTHAVYTLEAEPYRELTQGELDKIAENDPLRGY